MRETVTTIGGFLVIGYLATRIRFWRARADYWFARAMAAEGDARAMRQPTGWGHL